MSRALPLSLLLTLGFTFQKDLKAGDASMQRSMVYAIGGLRYDLMQHLSVSAFGSLSSMFGKKVRYIRWFSSMLLNSTAG